MTTMTAHDNPLRLPAVYDAHKRISGLFRVLLFLAVTFAGLSFGSPASSYTYAYFGGGISAGNDGISGQGCLCLDGVGCVSISGGISAGGAGVGVGGGCGVTDPVGESCVMSETGAAGLVDPICQIMVELDLLLKGTTGKAIATIALAALGFMALLGKISWKLAALIVTGIALLFGAESIISSLGAGDILNGQVGYAGDPISLTLNNLTNQITGTTGRAVGVVAVIIVGMGALMGKVSWTQCLVLITGLAMVYGASGLLHLLQYSDDAASSCVSETDTNNSICNSFFNIIDAMTGEMGASIATLGIMLLGFMAMLGKLSWVRAMMLAAGIALIFAASNVVALLSGPLSPCSLPINSDPLSQVICGFMYELQGPTGKTIATLAVIVVGILSMLGKVSWELGFVVAIGIALIFGADAIVSLFESDLSTINCGATPPSAPSTGNAIADVLCYIIKILYGPAGKALATVAVIMMGFGALMGKVSYSQAFIVAAGIAVTFGAPAIVSIVLPSANTTGCTVVPGGDGAIGAC